MSKRIYKHSFRFANCMI